MYSNNVTFRVYNPGLGDTNCTENKRKGVGVDRGLGKKGMGKG